MGVTGAGVPDSAGSVVPGGFTASGFGRGGGGVGGAIVTGVDRSGMRPSVKNGVGVVSPKTGNSPPTKGGARGAGRAGGA